MNDHLAPNPQEHSTVQASLRVRHDRRLSLALIGLTTLWVAAVASLVYIMFHKIRFSNSGAIAKSKTVKSISPDQSTANKVKTESEVTNESPAPSSSTTQSSSSSTSSAGQAGPLTVDGSSTATYPTPQPPPFVIKISSSSLSLRYDTNWISGTTLSSWAADPNWYDAADIASISIDGYDSSEVSIQTNFTGAPSPTVQITVHYLHLPSGPASTVPGGSTTAQIHATDVHGRTTSTSLLIDWQ